MNDEHNARRAPQVPWEGGGGDSAGEEGSIIRGGLFRALAETNKELARGTFPFPTFRSFFWKEPLGKTEREARTFETSFTTQYTRLGGTTDLSTISGRCYAVRGITD